MSYAKLKVAEIHVPNLCRQLSVYKFARYIVEIDLKTLNLSTLQIFTGSNTQANTVSHLCFHLQFLGLQTLALNLSTHLSDYHKHKLNCTKLKCRISFS